MKSYLLLILASLCLSLPAQRTIRGKVIGAYGEPLIGASVIVPGTTRGTITDINGNFSIVIPYGTKDLAASYSGFKKETVALGSSNVLTIRMRSSRRAGSNSSRAGRWRLSISGGHTISSAATYNAVGISTEAGNRYWAGVRIGYNLIRGKKTILGLDAGASYRDYGFVENGSNIPYGFVGGQIRMQRRLFWRLHLIAFGGGEYGKVLEPRYSYVNTTSGTNRHNLFLHQNDAATVYYGGGLGLGFGRFGLDFAFEKNLQMDTYDVQYGKTIGGRFSNLSLYYQF